MKRLNQYINDQQLIFEHFINAFSKEDMQKYADEVWTLLENAYAYCGGMAGMSSVEQLINETDLWKMVKRNNQIVAINTYSGKRGGRKLSYGGCLPTAEGKAGFVKMLEEDIKFEDRQTWGELSGKAEVTFLKNNVNVIPGSKAQQILNNKKILKVLDDGYHYIREIGGQQHTKLMVGNYAGFSETLTKEKRDELIEIAKQIGKGETL